MKKGKNGVKERGRHVKKGNNRVKESGRHVKELKNSAPGWKSM